MIDLTHRTSQPELMDELDIPSKELGLVLKDIDFTNRVLGGYGITVRSLRQLIKAHPRRSYSILDVGCGDGRMLRKIAAFLKKQSIEAELVGWDLNDKAVSSGIKMSGAYPEISFYQKDILEDIDRAQCFDFVIITLTLHHFDNAQLPSLLIKLKSLARIGVIINDLHRNRLAYALFKGFSTIFIRTRIARHDGLVSIKRGFTRKEFEMLAKLLPEAEHKIAWRWAFRWLWVINLAILKGTYE